MASTASHQVEGNTVNQWSQWELSNAKNLAKNAKNNFEKGKKLGLFIDWELVAEQASSEENYISGKGVDHYGLHEKDFKLLKSLSMNSFRFGIEWSRIEPEEGKWDAKELTHYHRYITKLKALGIEPVLTIWH